jgi:subtilisin family serine protease
MRGEGQIVCVCDTGFDRGVTNDVHPAFEGRVVRLYALGRPHAATDPNGHGTHVCGSVLGDLTAHDGTIIRGTAPAARQALVRHGADARAALAGVLGVRAVNIGVRDGPHPSPR